MLVSEHPSRRQGAQAKGASAHPPSRNHGNRGALGLARSGRQRHESRALSAHKSHGTSTREHGGPFRWRAFYPKIPVRQGRRHSSRSSPFVEVVAVRRGRRRSSRSSPFVEVVACDSCELGFDGTSSPRASSSALTGRAHVHRNQDECRAYGLRGTSSIRTSPCTRQPTAASHDRGFETGSSSA